MKRKITHLEQYLIANGWYLATKRYSGKHSEKTLSYEYHKTSDLRNDGKTYEQIIKLDQKRSKIVDYGIKNVNIEFLNSDELLFVKSLYLSLQLFVEKITNKNEIGKIEIDTMIDCLCEEMEK